MKVVYHPAVQKDVNGILRHYDEISPSLGDEFWSELALMNSQAKEQVVKRGTFLYGGTWRCAVEIVQTDFRAGTGDYEDPEEIREDARGVFYDIRYASAGPRPFSSGVIGLESLEAAVAHVESLMADVQWD